MLGHKQRRRMVRDPFMGQNSYYPYQTNPYFQANFPQNFYNNSYMGPNQPYVNPYNVHKNPYVNQQQGFIPFQMPYPNQNMNQPQMPAGGFHSIMNQFKSKDGGYDVNKMMNTAGQMMHTMNQIGGLVKQVSSIFKVKV